MRITKVDIPKTLEPVNGIEDIKMDKLGPIVLIAGKNGSGKSRILNRIFAILNQKPTKNIIDASPMNIESTRNAIAGYESQINLIKHQLLTPGPNNSGLNNQLVQYQKGISDFQKNISNFEYRLNWKHIETTEPADKYTSIQFVPKNLNLNDPRSNSPQSVIDFANSINKVGMTVLPQGSLAKIQVIQNRWFHATHQNAKLEEEEKNTAIEDYRKLQGLITVFLDTKIGRTIDDEATLFGFPLGQAKLSDGQKILLQFCMAIFSQETALKDLILVMDEPENHLHPSIIIDTIDRIQKYNSDGQIWIATHSIPLLAHYDPSQIWFVENNKISHAGKIPEKVLASLLGNESEIAKLQDFISLPAQFATSRHAFECLIDAPVVMTDAKDPQSVQIKQELLKLTADGKKLRVLDYGAGQGRLIANIFDLDEASQSHLIEQLDYIAYDEYPNNQEQCKNFISRAYGNSDKRYFNDIEQLHANYDKRSFNVVVMCNVLHEIDPKNWLGLFSEQGIISSLLADNGVLLLVEDTQMPIGEKAYQKGFLVLDTPQLKDLFAITEKDGGFRVADHRGDGRLKAHQIPRECLIRITPESRLTALQATSQTARRKILKIREEEKNYKNGKLHGFWTQQLANAELNIAELSAK